VRSIARLLAIVVVWLAIKVLLVRINLELAAAWPDGFRDWQIGGLLYYGSWIVALCGLHAVMPSVSVSVALRPAPGAWVTSNVVILAVGAALAAIDAMVHFHGWHAPTSAALGVSAIVLAPIVEEWLFRGVIWDRVVALTPPRARVVIAIVVTSLMFAWWHAADPLHPFATAPGPLVGYAQFGLAMGVLRWRFGCIGVGLVAHALYNAGGVFAG
jgi:membrane protease YdiL (CAAX protease family)